MEFKVFTLNCWGLFLVAKDRAERMQAIADFLYRSEYDVVCLQEIWMNKDFQLVKEQAAKSLPYSHYFYSGVTGSGVAILSKHPIEEAFYHQWPVNGYIHKIHHGDWFGGKGVGLCKLRVQNLRINVYSAHLHAEYNRNCDEYKAHRVLQAFDTAQFINVTSGGADLVVLAGDLNTEPGDLAYKILLSVSGLIDSFNESDAQENVATNENLNNSYTPKNFVKQNIQGKRIDYILYHPGSSQKVKLKNYSFPLPSQVPDRHFSYSDHEAVTVSLILEKSFNSLTENNCKIKREALEEGIAITNEALADLVSHGRYYKFLAMASLLLLVSAFATDAPLGFNVSYHVLKVVLSGAFFFGTLMATIWNRLEKHGVLATKCAMEINLHAIDLKKDV